MKNLGFIGFIGFIALLLGTMSFSTETEPKVKTVTIKTNAVCGSCKNRIEKELNYTKGVIFAELDLDTKELVVKYKTKFLNESDLHKTINNLGYSTNKSERNVDAFEKLPKCCQSEGHCEKDH